MAVTLQQIAEAAGVSRGTVDRALYRKKADSGGKMNYKNVKIAEGARIAKQSVILGNVTIGRDSCVLYYAVMHGMTHRWK